LLFGTVYNVVQGGSNFGVKCDIDTKAIEQYFLVLFIMQSLSLPKKSYNVTDSNENYCAAFSWVGGVTVY